MGGEVDFSCWSLVADHSPLRGPIQRFVLAHCLGLSVVPRCVCVGAPGSRHTVEEHAEGHRHDDGADDQLGVLEADFLDEDTGAEASRFETRA